MKRVIKFVANTIWACIGLFGLVLTINNGKNFLEMSAGTNSQTTFLYDFGYISKYSVYSFIWIILLITIYKIIRIALQEKNKKTITSSLIFAFLFSIFQIIGNCVNSEGSIDIISRYPTIFLIKLAGLMIVIYSILIIALNKAKNLKPIEGTKELSVFTSNFKSILIVTVVIFLCWIPYFLKYYPGVIQYDSVYQMQQVLGDAELSSKHSLLIFLLIKMSIEIGKNVFHSINSGVAIYTIIQMIIMSFSFSYIIYYMSKKKINSIIRFFVLLYFAFWPTFPIMAITMLKDSIFGTFIALDCLIIIEIVTNTEKFLKTKIRIVASCVIIILTAFLRNNFIYAYILCALIIILYKKDFRKKLGILLLSPFIGYLIINFIVNSVLGIKQEKKYLEIYAVPLQQVTRVLVDNEEKMSEEEIKQIKKFFKEEDRGVGYQMFLADASKENYNNDYLGQNQGKFLIIWLKLLFKYPKSYFDAFFCLVSGYFDISETRISIWLNINPNDYQIYNTPIMNPYIVRFAEEIIYYQNVPIIGLIYNCALGLILLLFLVFINYNLNKKENIIALTILYTYFFTILLGPLNNEYRYIFFEYTSLPLAVILTFKNTFININKEKILMIEGEENG